MAPVLFTHALLVEMLTGHPSGNIDPFPASRPPAPPATPASNNMFLLWRRQAAYLDDSGDKDAMAAANERGAYGGVDGGGGGYYGGGSNYGGSYLSTGAIVGIVLGCIFCLMIMVWLFWCCASLGAAAAVEVRRATAGRGGIAAGGGGTGQCVRMCERALDTRGDGRWSSRTASVDRSLLCATGAAGAPSTIEQGAAKLWGGFSPW
ncbi:hypothetical protein PG990_001257 [Apiospora arundinis]